jgi:hypothetical protein
MEQASCLLRGTGIRPVYEEGVLVAAAAVYVNCDCVMSTTPFVSFVPSVSLRSRLNYTKARRHEGHKLRGAAEGQGIAAKHLVIERQDLVGNHVDRELLFDLLSPSSAHLTTLPRFV